jgi:signal transduction histidine kinase
VSLNIFAIEDDRDALTNLQDILRLDGHRVTGAGTLKEASTGRDWSEFSLILLDRQLPDGSADALLPHLQAAAPRAAVIVITGHADLEGTMAAVRHGAADYLLKPINPDLLRATVARVARMQELEERARQAERLAAIGQAMAVLSHESGNALARSQAVLEMLALEVQDRPEALELIARARKAQDALLRLYEGVRNFAATIKLDRDLWDLSAAWRQAWANVLGAGVPAKGASLVEHTAEVDLRCEADHFRLEQVFRNLFENALAACPGPARVEVVCSDTMLQGRPALRVAVRNNGPGLPPGLGEKVFAPFFTTKKKETGLGLAIVRRIVEAHGWEALEQLRRGGLPRVIFLDLAMPEMDGWEFLHQRRHCPELRDVPVVVFSTVAEFCGPDPRGIGGHRGPSQAPRPSQGTRRRAPVLPGRGAGR